MTGRHGMATRLAWLASGLALLLSCGVLSLAALLWTDPSYRSTGSTASVPDVVMVLIFAIAGAVVTIKRPDNLVGWALTLASLGLLVGGVLGAYAELALLAAPDAGLPGGAAAAVLAEGSWVPLMAGVLLLVIVFPSGRPATRRWGHVAAAGLVAFAVVWALISTSPGSLDAPFDAYDNPLTVTETETYAIAAFLLIQVCLVTLAAAAIHLLLRFRRSVGQERQQFKWFAASASLLVITLPFAVAFDFSAVAGDVFGITLMALPVSVGIAVLRYRLYEIDRLVSRTLVYGAVTALLAGVYFAVVLALQATIGSAARGNDLLIAASTLAAAALFRPVRTRVQTLVDRRFNRRRYDTEHTIATFTHQLRDEVDLDRLAHDLAHVVHDTMQPTHLSLWLRERP